MKQETGIVNIRGKEYATVAKRVQDFRQAHPDWSLVAELLECNDTVVRFRAVITDESGRVRAVGHSEEYRKASEINKTSAVENAETSAWGRALAALGYAGANIATVEEIEKAQRTEQAQRESAKSVAKASFDDLPEDRKKALADMGADVTGYFEEGKELAGFEAYTAYTEDMSTEEKAAFWSLFPSTIRSTIKRMGAERKAA